MVHLLRTRRLNLTRLEEQPPVDLAAVHATLHGAVGDVQTKLAKLERTFYGSAKDAAGEVNKWAPAITAVLTDARMPYLNAAAQIDDIVNYVVDPARVLKVNIFDTNRLRECLKKVLEAVPGRFEGVMQDLRRILRQLEKYCLSFYNLDDDVFLDTSHNYERQRLDYASEIEQRLNSVTQLAEKFKGKGVFLRDLSFDTRELARKTDCARMPFLLLFPEACRHVQDACIIMTTWLAADANYATFLSNDINDLEHKKHDLERSLKEQQHRFHKVKFRSKQTQGEYEKLKAETAKLHEKEDELLVDEERLTSETNEMQIDIEMREFRRDELIKKATSMSTEALYEKYSEISEEIRALRLQLPALQRRLHATKHKLNWLRDKKKELQDVEKELSTVQEDLIEVEVGRDEKEKDLYDTTHGLELAKQLYLFKISTDALKKIYHDQPVTVNRQGPTGKRVLEDSFESACRVVAAHIESQWPRLYRHLPFFPPRGNNTIDGDITALGSDEARDGTEATALRALEKWRRFHTRAKVEDLMRTLRLINRQDLLHRLHLELNPPDSRPLDEQLTLEEEALNAYIDPALLPFLKEVERFDQLRAANRI